MMFMSLLTIRQRMMNNAFVSEEDAMYLKGMVSRINEHVERVRSANMVDTIESNSVNPVNIILTLDNPAFCIYLLCACLLVLKMMAVTLLTIYNRFKFKAFISSEDAKWMNGQVTVNDTVERIRRAHQNDLENIPIFLAAGFAYLWIQPHVGVAWALYLGFTIVRALHTIVYTLIIFPQPTRALMWLAGFLITGYLFYTAILVMKMMIMTLLTIRQRIINNALVSEEDAIYLKGTVCRTNEHVERVRRGHRNDMENIYLFFIIGFAYIWSNPDPFWANLLFLTFTLSRIFHTFVYTIVIIRQPARGCAWLIGYLIIGYMAMRTFLHFY
ncbi:prostaglandin E synthase-like, partial [Asbolus verrucosus]